eukprot:TRINITY_DN19706_c0_g1_i2.p1 TRINITY_DN19706_c0_g1~~TRINITY_DN19706_c0_g1_i2.p1  ORF type:complete len:179 (+),score=32.56 TRINITY_DN19706_c0_g1_i2:73-609(+)
MPATRSPANPCAVAVLLLLLGTAISQVYHVEFNNFGGGGPYGHGSREADAALRETEECKRMGQQYLAVWNAQSSAAAAATYFAADAAFYYVENSANYGSAPSSQGTLAQGLEAYGFSDVATTLWTQQSCFPGKRMLSTIWNDQYPAGQVMSMEVVTWNEAGLFTRVDGWGLKGNISSL